MTFITVSTSVHSRAMIPGHSHLQWAELPNNRWVWPADVIRCAAALDDSHQCSEFSWSWSHLQEHYTVWGSQYVVLQAQVALIQALFESKTHYFCWFLYWLLRTANVLVCFAVMCVIITLLKVKWVCFSVKILDHIPVWLRGVFNSLTCSFQTNDVVFLFGQCYLMTYSYVIYEVAKSYDLRSR